MKDKMENVKTRTKQEVKDRIKKIITYSTVSQCVEQNTVNEYSTRASKHQQISVDSVAIFNLTS